MEGLEGGMVKCARRHLWPNRRTCRQAHRAYFEDWCIPCYIRYDHECGKHKDDLEPRCPLCRRER
jgi:hypothetical protein